MTIVNDKNIGFVRINSHLNCGFFCESVRTNPLASAGQNANKKAPMCQEYISDDIELQAGSIIILTHLYFAIA